MTKHRLLISIIFLTFIALGLPDALLGSAWNQARLDLNQPIRSIGLVTFTMYVMTILSTFLGPHLLTRFSTKTITLVSVLLTGSALILMSQVTVFTGLMLLAVPLGLGAGAIDLSLNHYVATKLDQAHMAYLHAFYGVGVSTGPFLMGVALALYTWRTGFLLVGGLLLVIALSIFVSFPLWPKEAPDSLEVPDISVRRALKARGVKLSILIFTWAVHVESFMGIFVATYAFAGLGLDLATSAFATSIFYAGLTLGRVVSGLFAKKFSSNQMIVAGQSLMILAALLLFIPSVPTVFSMGLFGLMGAGSAPIYPGMMSMNTVNFKPTQISRIISLQMVIGYVGFGFMTPLLGSLLDLFSMALFPVILLVGSLILWGLTTTFITRHPPVGNV